IQDLKVLLLSRRLVKQVHLVPSTVAVQASIVIKELQEQVVSEDVLEEDIRSEEDDDPSPPLIRSVRIPMFKRKNLNPKPLPSYKNTDLRWNSLLTTRANQDNLREFEDNLLFQMACEYHKTVILIERARVDSLMPKVKVFHKYKHKDKFGKKFWHPAKICWPKTCQKLKNSLSPNTGPACYLIAEELNMSMSIVHSIVTGNLNMRKVGAKAMSGERNSSKLNSAVKWYRLWRLTQTTRKS
ncbi:hypothetical protein QYM36_015077, partial [Artemia franciscana]